MESTKLCSRCNRYLPLDCFRWRNKSKGIKHSRCKECQKETDRLYYSNSLVRRSSVRNIADEQKQRNLEVVNKAKSCGCAKCGDSRLYVLDFHHIDPTTKSGVIAHLVAASSLDNLLTEINKCVVLCANCHREWHYLNKTFGVSLQEYLNS